MEKPYFVKTAACIYIQMMKSIQITSSNYMIPGKKYRQAFYASSSAAIIILYLKNSVSFIRKSKSVK